MFAHLHCHSPFSFLDGASSLTDLVATAAKLEIPALALTDHDNLCGAFQFQRLALAAGIKPITGVELTITSCLPHPIPGETFHITLLAGNPTGYQNLCRLLSQAHLDNPRGRPQIAFTALTQNREGLFCLSGCRRGEIPALLLKRHYQEALAAATRYRAVFGPAFYLELIADFLPGSRGLITLLRQLADHLEIPVVATNNVHYAVKEHFPYQDLLTCVRTLTTLDTPHPERRLNAENYLKSPRQMQELFPACPQAITNTLLLAEQCAPSLPGGEHLFPLFPVPPGTTAGALLTDLTRQGAQKRYGSLTPTIRERLDHELAIINRLGFADYFLLVWDLVRFARRAGIRLAGRGSAADSAVAYCLGITEVDAISRNLLFERFLSLEQARKPDIDIDFDSRHRDRVALYLTQKYGAAYVAGISTYNTFRARGAVRDLGKAFNFPPAELDNLAKSLPGMLPARDIPAAFDRFPELKNAAFDRKHLAPLLTACTHVCGFPRFLGTHLGGIVVSRLPLNSLVPLQTAAKGIVITQYDKESIEETGLVKLDLLSLRTLAVVEDTAAAVRETGETLDYDRLPLNDPATYRRLGSGDTIGIFQLESPAQRALQSRLGATNMEDIIASVALIRPGPIQGDMVGPFIRRRQGLEPVNYLHPELEPILKNTYGVVLFQEQVLQIVTTLARFTPGEADRLRRLMSHRRSFTDMAAIGEEFVRRCTTRGISPEKAREIFQLVQGYAGYGFCEAHAAAFATTAYKTAYLVEHHPAAFFTALLNHQPTGFYPAHTIINAARLRRVAILPLDINLSDGPYLTMPQTPPGIRVGLAAVSGMRTTVLQAILKERAEGGPFLSFTDFQQRVTIPRDLTERLILAGAFDSLCPHRKSLLWQIPGRGKNPATATGLFPRLPAWEAGPALPGDFSPWEKICQEYAVLGIFQGLHPLAYWRPLLHRQGISPAAVLPRLRTGRQVTIAGLVIRPHRPPTRSGKTVVFFSLEDETGLAEITLFSEGYRRFGQLLFGPVRSPLKVTGTVSRPAPAGQPALIAHRIERLAIADTPPPGLAPQTKGGQSPGGPI
ncbi:MAG: DNA polymerase III subunit alpha [Heliobacteriaceae bacterium]|nr:DNA polymerase III subunit alpha [Heliobacteriaceae bacterium]